MFSKISISRIFSNLTLLAVLLALLLAQVTPALAARGDTLRLSVDSSGVEGTGGDSYYPSISADGRYVAFQSRATNLVSGDTNSAFDIFVRDTQLNTTTRVSVSSSGAQANNDSFHPSISPDGRYVVFESLASNLVSGDTNAKSDIFVRDRDTDANGTYDEVGQVSTTRLSVSSSGAQATDDSEKPSISSNGRYVVFQSRATNLVSGDTNSAFDVFLRDRDTNANGIYDEVGQVSTTRISVSSSGAQTTGGGSFNPSISADGRYVTYYSFASNLVINDTNATYDIFVRDRDTDANGIYDEVGQVSTIRVSVDDASGAQANGGSYDPSISADGRYVVFQSLASDLVSGDTNDVPDIFVRDIQLNTTTRVSVNSGGTQGNSDSYEGASISADGQFVAFASAASNLVGGDNNAKTDIFVRDTLANTTTRVSLDTSLTEGDHHSYYPSIALDGAGGYFVAFASTATNLVSGDTNEVSDIFLHDNQFNADTTAPNVTINKAAGQLDPVTQPSAAPINFTAVFDEPIKPATFTGADLTLSGTVGTLSAVVSQDAPNDGTTFNIAVSGMSGDGTVTASLGINKVTDLAGNGNTASTHTDNSVTYEDETPPSVAMSSTSASPINGAITVTVTFSENVTGFVVGDIAVTNSAKSNFAGSGAVYTFDLTPSVDGPVTANIAAGVAFDPANNGNTAAPQFSRLYDATAPTTSIVSQPPNQDTNTTPTFIFSGDDGPGGSGVASFMCQLDGGSYSVCASPFTSPALTDGSHTFSVYAIDNASNADASPASYTWLIDTSPPTVVSSSLANVNPNDHASVGFTVTFSESVTGVDITDFTLTTTGVTGASITGVTGSGATYTVSVNTGSGNGTIRLDVVDDDSIVDLIPNPLGGAGPSNGNFTAGEVYTIIKPVTLIVKSTGAQDGWILESTETSGKGGTLNTKAATFYLGDNAAKRQYRGILSFKTGASLPDNAVITSVTLRFRKQGVAGGGNPVKIFKGFMVDIKTGVFNKAALQITDFQAKASRTYGPFKPAPVGGWYSIALPGAEAFINKLATSSGLTQIRLRFKLDDNNNKVANYLKVYSGNATAAANRPQLVITYYVPVP